MRSAAVLPGVLLQHECLLSRIAVRTEAEDVREEGAEEGNCAEMGGVTGDRRKLHNEALHYLNPQPLLAVQIKDIDMGRVCSTHEGEENCLQGIVGETRRKETIWKAWAQVGV